MSAHDKRVDALRRAFEDAFGRPPAGFAEAPGRVNLIGEHLDYNDGLVLPFAIEQSVIAAWAPGVGTVVRALAADSGERAEFDARIVPPRDGTWADYVRGVASALGDAGYALRGADVAFAGDVPAGAGLSSSAAVEVAVAAALCEAAGVDVPRAALAVICQRAENSYVGVQSGIMDQFTSALAEPDAALLIDCRSLAHRPVPLRERENGLAVIITDSGVRRELASSAFNDRRRECEQAVARLRETLTRPDLESLRDVALADLPAEIAQDDPIMRRARHVVTEIARVAAAVEALERDDFGEVGRLMVESHLSLRDDYEVSSPELDLLVALATAQPYVLGSRLTGAGFGGCTVTLAQADALDRYERDVVVPYRARTRQAARTYVALPQPGLHVWRA